MPVTYTLTYETIKFTGGEISVRGLGIPEISQLVSLHTEAAMALFSEISALGAKETVSIEVIIFSAFQRFQAAVSHMVALAADAPEDYDTILKLPPDVIFTAVEKTINLTFAMDGGVKKFWQIVLEKLGENHDLQARIIALSKPFMNGSGLSEAS